MNRCSVLIVLLLLPTLVVQLASGASITSQSSDQTTIEPSESKSAPNAVTETSQTAKLIQVQDEAKRTQQLGAVADNRQQTITPIDVDVKERADDETTRVTKRMSEEDHELNRRQDMQKSKFYKWMSLDGDQKNQSANDSNDQNEEVDKAKLIKDILRKAPYAEYLSVEQKWEDLFSRVMRLQKLISRDMSRDMLHQLENVDVNVGSRCLDDLLWLRTYVQSSSNVRFMAHMADSLGKPESGMLGGQVHSLGHAVECVKARAPNVASDNTTFDERFFIEQTEALGERFRGQFCLASVRPVLPPRPKPIVSTHSPTLDISKVGNLSMMHSFDGTEREPFESELFQFELDSHALIYELPRMMGVCYPSSCSREDVRASLQDAYNGMHQVVDIEFECEIEDEINARYASAPVLGVGTTRGVALVLLSMYVVVIILASIINATGIFGRPDKRLKWWIEQANNDNDDNNQLDSIEMINSNNKLMSTTDDSQDPAYGLVDLANSISISKCASIMFIKTEATSSKLTRDWDARNLRSTSIDSLRGFLVLCLIYAQVIHLGALGPQMLFMWAKWADSMFPFYRSLGTQFWIGSFVWSDAFYFIAGYTALMSWHSNRTRQQQQLISDNKHAFLISMFNRYFRLLVLAMATIALNYVWPMMSNGYVMTDQAFKLQNPCNDRAWTQILMFNNYGAYLNEPSVITNDNVTQHDMCMWPAHVTSSMMQLHVLSYILIALIVRRYYNCVYLLSGVLIVLLGSLWPAMDAAKYSIVAPFSIDYPDRFNYRNIIERLVTPTHNHITAYLIGFLVAMSRYRSHSLKVNFNDNSGNTDRGINWLRTIMAMALVIVTCSASYLWIWIALPVESTHMFIYHALIKLVFSIAFAWLFVELRVGQQKNSNDPWMVTRFLVPIGRMSYSVYMISWLVVWFDLLTSLYQWYPSHYFVFEKYLELAFMTLAISFFAFALFEGPLITLRRLFGSSTTATQLLATNKSTFKNTPIELPQLFTTKTSTNPLGPKRLTSTDHSDHQNQLADDQRLSVIRPNTSFSSLTHSMQSIDQSVQSGPTTAPSSGTSSPTLPFKT